LANAFAMKSRKWWHQWWQHIPAPACTEEHGAIIFQEMRLFPCGKWAMRDSNLSLQRVGNKRFVQSLFCRGGTSGGNFRKSFRDL